MKEKFLSRNEKIQVVIFVVCLAVCYVPFGALLGWMPMLGYIAATLFHFVLTVVAANLVWHVGINFDWWW